MKLSLAIATLFLTATTALPAFAAAPAPMSAVSLRDAAATPIEAVQHRQTTKRQRHSRTYRNGRRAFGQYYYGQRNPYPQRVYPNAWSGSWGHCAGGLGAGADSAFPDWDTCSGR